MRTILWATRVSRAGRRRDDGYVRCDVVMQSELETWESEEESDADASHGVPAIDPSVSKSPLDETPTHHLR